MHFMQKETIGRLQTQVKELKKEKLVLESLMQDLVREREARENFPKEEIVDELLECLADTKRIQENEAKMIDAMERQKEKLKEIVADPAITEAMKYPLKAKICSLLNRDKPKKPQ